MGVDIAMWRVRIGCFCQPNRSVNRLRVLTLPKSTYKLCFMCVRATMCLSIMLMLCGDVEINPGPPKSDNSRKFANQRASTWASGATGTASDIPDSIRGASEGVTTRQRKISSYTHSQPLQDATRSPRLNDTGSCDNSDMYNFLKQMKVDLDSQNKQVVSDISRINSKMDSLFSTISDLKRDNECLKRDNISLKKEVSKMQQKLDQYENQSRRNNLRFNGISGKINEPWSVTEDKLRTFLQDTLNFGQQASEIDIDRAHRIKTRDSNKCTVIARFTRYNDCELILERARSVLTPGSNFSVQQDYSERIRRHRKVLGERMLAERARNNYATIRYDKLIVNDEIYKYCDESECIISLGRRNFANRRTRGPPRGVQTVNTRDDQLLVEPYDDTDVTARNFPHDSDQPMNSQSNYREDDVSSNSSTVE